MEIARLLGIMSKEERLALSELVRLHDDVAAHHPSLGQEDGDLCIVDRFRGFQAAKTIAFGCSGVEHTYSIISKKDGPTGQYLIHDARSSVELETRKYQMRELAHDLLQFWELFLRYHTTLDLKEFSAAVRRGLLGRVTDTVFHQATLRRLMPSPEVAPASASIEVLEAEIVARLGRVAFNLEERELLRPALTKYTGKTLADASNEDAKRDKTRIRNSETELLSELIHLPHSVRKWLRKQDRTAELDVITKFRLYRISASLVNVLKHGVVGRSHDCAVIDLEVPIYERAYDVATPDDRVIDVGALVNYNGELHMLHQLAEDLVQLWELFLRHHSQLPLEDFRIRLGRVLSARKGMTTYSAPIPDGLKAWAKREANRRKQLDIEK